MSAMMVVILEVTLSTLRVSTPLLFAAMGGMFSERSGVINIALEGLMLVGAFAAAAVAAKTGSPVLGTLAGAGAGVLLASVYAFSVIQLRADQVVAGLAINMFAAGITPFCCKLLYDSTSSTPSLPMSSQFQWAPMLWVWVVVFGAALVVKYTPFGLWVRFAGEHPAALDSAGIRVNRIRWLGVLISGALAGIGGATLSVFLSSSFSRDMTAGRGYMALAALIFGKWKPIPAAIACLLFGLTDALQIRLQGVILWGHHPVPVQFIQMTPYVATIILLAGWVGRSRAPKSLGIPFTQA